MEQSAWCIRTCECGKNGWQKSAEQDWIADGSPHTLEQRMIIIWTSLYYVSTFLGLFHTHYFSINIVLNVSKNIHFLNTPSHFADVIYGWFLNERVRILNCWWQPSRIYQRKCSENTYNFRNKTYVLEEPQKLSILSKMNAQESLLYLIRKSKLNGKNLLYTIE